MIFGNAAPKFQVSAVDVLLDFAVIEKDEVDYRTVEHESGLNRARKFITKPEHHVFQVLIHLHRYQDPRAKHDEIVVHLNATCQLWRHRDGQAFQDDASADADFILIEYQQVYITTTDYADGLRLLFKSIDVIDHSDFGDNWTFARALTSGSSNAWYLDPTSGLMVVAPDSTTARRLVKGRYKGTAIVIEGARSNILVNRISNAAWTKLGITAAATTETLDPAGLSNADSLLSTSPGGSVSQQSGTPVGNDVATEFWLKSSVGNVACTLQVGGTTGNDNVGITVTPIWRPFSFSADSAGYTGNIGSALFITNDATKIYSWHTPQLEDNAFFSSEIIDPLATAGATRALENFKILSANTKLTKLKGTVSMLIKPYFLPIGGDTSGFHTIFESGDSAGGATNLHISFQFDKFGGDRLKLRVFRDNGSTGGLVWVPGFATGMTQNTWHHIVFTWDATVSNGGHIYVDGAELGSGSTNDPFNVSDIYDTIAIGTKNFNNEAAFGEYDELFIDDRVWSAEEVLAVFNLPNGLPRTLI